MKWLNVLADHVMDHPADAVWDFVSNVENMGRWVKDVKGPRWTSEGERGVGSTFESGYEYGGKTHELKYEVTGFRPPTEFATRTTGGCFPHQSTITVESVDGETKVTHDMMAGSDGVVTAFMFAVGGAFFKLMMRRRVLQESETMSEEIGKDVLSV